MSRRTLPRTRERPEFDYDQDVPVTMDDIRAAMARFTERQLLILERLPKSTSRFNRELQEALAREMVEACRHWGVEPQPWTYGTPSTPRLDRLLAD